MTCHRHDTLPQKIGKNVTVIDQDPTSYARLQAIMSNTIFSNLFIVIEELEDVEYILKNLSLIKSKVRIVLMNQWDGVTIGEEHENLSVLHADTLLASHLYNQLPNVPLIAQNVGLGQGEVMEVYVPNGSSYAHRHIGSILQKQWKIVAIYRQEKQIMASNSIMILPNDTLLIVGKPIVLDGVYRTINKRIGLFPEPFGKDIYLILDFRYDKKHAIRYLLEALHLLDKLEEKRLFVRILYPNDFMLLDTIKHYENENVTIAVSYKNEGINDIIKFDIQEHEIGLVMNSMQRIKSDNLQGLLYQSKKLVYLFGELDLIKSRAAMVLMSEQKRMESISATAFDIAEQLGIKLSLCDFNPDGDFDSKKMIIEHYDTLTQIFNKEISINKKVTNPIREMAKLEHILQIVPFEKSFNTHRIKTFISTDPNDFILVLDKHPKLLIPFNVSEA